ncbi:MAG: indolepyruvate ferredoxin oxidoreductase subunit alpha [Actinomycetia bacterium]|nr:indolepyruvate ferredoxin oxidoreductase subunit alpha [Actinomycetes bacterium]MCP3910701.1 indolepyruvate ferredoxin oxidoreductase subunit alpha [Actinomycetes bacterium]MCP4084537.1 indolepyruvate ferredoxin oxidoreductase subunit alpha [Actinomycetes bacterium]
MTGNEALARGAWQAGVEVAASYPGTPSTEIMEALGEYPSADLHAQWSPNEKVALDVAIGAALAGVRAACTMKHVGLNVAADAFMSLTYIGVNAGLVLVVCDDPGIHSSQNEQDTRLLARMAHVPVLEPSDAQEALDFMGLAFDISERFDTPVIVRSTTRLSHTRSLVQVGDRRTVAPRPFVADPTKAVMIPAHARLRHPLLLEREAEVGSFLADPALAQAEGGDPTFGVITAGLAFTYVKEVVGNAPVLKLAGSYPLATDAVEAFCDTVDRVFVVEELEPVIEEAVGRLGIEVEGKQWFPRVGELSPLLVATGFASAGVLEAPPETGAWEVETVVRPPVLCAGCPHVSSYLATRAVGVQVAGDIGCYTLAAIEPLEAIDTTVSMGSSIGNAIGMAKAGTAPHPVVATIGDSTFLHAGLPALLDAVYNLANITVLLLDNGTVAMTGGQDHPGTGRTLRGEATHRVNYEELCRAVGVDWIRRVDSYDLAAVHQALREGTEYEGVAVIISDRPCVLDPVKIVGPAFRVDSEACTACQSCMNLGCPAILWSDETLEGKHKVRIDEAACIGCSLCVQVCPTDGFVPVLTDERS